MTDAPELCPSCGSGGYGCYECTPVTYTQADLDAHIGAAEQRVLERVRREARVEGMRAAGKFFTALGLMGDHLEDPARVMFEDMIAAEERGEDGK